MTAWLLGNVIVEKHSPVEENSAAAQDVEAEGVGTKLLRKFRDKCDRDRRGYSRRECREWLEGLSRAQIRLINLEYAIDRFNVTRDAGSVRSEGVVDAQASRCYDTPNLEEATLRAYNRAGGELFWVRQTINWCGDGNNKITSFRPRDIDFQIAGWNILWKYRGVDEGSSREGVYLNNDGEYYQAKTRIIFEACIGPEFTGLLCDTAYPTFDEIGTPKGGYEGQKSW